MNVNIPRLMTIQTLLRNVLIALFNGTTLFSRRNPKDWMARFSLDARYWRYPLFTPALIESCQSLGMDFETPARSSADVYQLIGLLKRIEQPLMEALLKIQAESAFVYVGRNFNPELYYQKPIDQLKTIFPIQELPGISLFLHGSMADLKFTPFSDVDDLILVRQGAWKDPEQFIQIATCLAHLARRYQDIDPFQHHGHWVLTEFDLLFYDQSYLPLIVLDEAVRVVGEKQFTYRINRDSSGFVKNSQTTLKHMQEMLVKAQREDGLGAFELKALVGEIALLPAYLFQGRGQILSKPVAIARASELYSSQAIKALDWASMVRNEFGSLIGKRRIKLLGRIAKLACARRQQAQGLFHRYAPFVQNRDTLGLSPEIVGSIQVYMQESLALVAGLDG